MPLVLVALWIVFNGRVQGDVLVSGIIVASLVSVFCYRYMGYRFKQDLFVLRNVARIARYFFIVVVQMFLANIQIVGYVLVHSDKVKPTIIHFQPDVNTVPGRVMLANTITIIPGSVTGEMTNNGFSVHALTPEIAKAQQGSVFERYICEMEADKNGV